MQVGIIYLTKTIINWNKLFSKIIAPSQSSYKILATEVCLKPDISILSHQSKYILAEISD